MSTDVFYKTLCNTDKYDVFISAMTLPGEVETFKCGTTQFLIKRGILVENLSFGLVKTTQDNEMSTVIYSRRAAGSKYMKQWTWASSTTPSTLQDCGVHQDNCNMTFGQMGEDGLQW